MMIMLKRLLLVFFLATATMRATAGSYTDIWYNPAEPGWGVNLVESDNFLFATFFIYGQNGSPTWYTAQLTWDGSKFTGGLYATGGTWFAAPWQPGNWSVAQAGTASFQPSSVNAYQGTLIYTVNGLGTVSKAIERQTLTTIGLGGSYTGGQSGAYSGCSNSANNGSYIDRYDLNVTHLAGISATFQFLYTSGTVCTLSGTLVQYGQLYRIPNATYQCSSGLNTAATVEDIKATALGIEGRFGAASVGGGCREDAQFSAVLQ